MTVHVSSPTFYETVKSRKLQIYTDKQVHVSIYITCYPSFYFTFLQIGIDIA